MRLDELATGLEIPDEQAKKLVAGVKQIDPEKWVDLADNVDTIKSFTIFQNWPRLIDVVHDTTDLISRSGFKAEYDVPPGETKHKHLSLVDSNCCMCPTAYFSSSIGSYMLLTNIVNKDADVRREWQDIKPFIDEPMPSERQRDFYVEPPKRVVDVYFENRHSTKTGTGRFYAEFDSMVYDKGENLVKWFLEEIAKEVVDITLKPSILGGASVDFSNTKKKLGNPAPHYGCKYQGKEVKDKKRQMMACYYCQGFYYEKGAYLRHDVVGFFAPAPRWADTLLRFDCPATIAAPLSSDLVTKE